MGDIGGCYIIGIPSCSFSASVDCGAKGVHKGSVWTEAVLRKFMEKLDVVVVCRSIDAQEMIVS